MRWTLRLGLAAIAAGVIATPTTSTAATGVAFVHGTGRQTDALHDYWTPQLVDRVASGLDDPSRVAVIDCDFSQYMWDEGAAGCLADQLLDFIDAEGIDDLVVITHSNGANVMRWVLSNPSYDDRYPPIIAATRWVDALAPSSLGTPLADAAMHGTRFETSLGWLLGYGNDAVAMQQTASMAWYNENYLFGSEGRPPLPVPMWATIGTDVESSPLDHDSYCGGYGLNLGLEFTQSWLDDCSDGFIECSSAAGAGTPWAYDHEFTVGGETLSHAQSRRDCFGLGASLQGEI
jgi:pimeloyl-ACP methyl ester carboxylesterase